MKVTITISNEKVKQIAGVIALMSSSGAPDGLTQAIDETEETDITESIDEADRDKLHLALSIYALQKIAATLVNDND